MVVPGSGHRSHSNGMTLWHRLQRSWPLTQVKTQVDDTLARPRIVALFPKSTRDPYGIQVQLEKIKQGTYHSKRATFVTFRISLNTFHGFAEACIEIRLAAQSHAWYKKASTPPPFIGAYGPTHIEEISDRAREGERIPASVQMSLTSRGALATVRGRVPDVQIIAEGFYLGIVVVHEEAVQLKILPSTIDCRRARAFRRTQVHPINLEMRGDAGFSLTTCALQGEGGCHPSCDNFDAAHMTPEMWKLFLCKRDAELYEGDAVNVRCLWEIW